MDNFKVYNNYFHDKRPHIFPLVYGSFEIIRDVPSLKYKMIRDKLIDCINEAEKEIILETPYFVPDHIFIHALHEATKRGVKITIIIPKEADYKVVEIMTSSYVGKLHSWGVNVKQFTRKFLHAKVALFDDKVFSFGSTNLDHRSFFFQYELNIFGKDKRLKDIVKKHINETLKGCSDFDYESWKNRSFFIKIQELILRPFRAFM
jgi:cardiolipin synthase